MKILSVIETLGYGGAERQLVTTLGELVKRGHICDVAALWAPFSLKSELGSAGVMVYPLNLKHRWLVPEAVWKLGTLCMRNKYDIVHGHLFFATLYSRILKALHQAPCVVSTLHSVEYDSYPASTTYKKFRKWINGYTGRKFDDATVAVSRAVAQHYMHHLRFKNPIVITNSVPTQNLSAYKRFNIPSLRDYFGLPKEGFIIICVGRFVHEKGHRYLIDALHLLNVRHNLAPMVILIGNGPLLPDITKQINNLGLTHQVSIRDFVQHDELLKLISVADIYLQPSLHEGCGLTIMEAMALGIPVIASATGGINELIENGISSILIQPADPGAIADALFSLVDNVNKRNEMGIIARQRVQKNFDVKVICDLWIKLYDRVVNRAVIH